jgi:abortive infection bacteriophage resistance protein
MHDMFMHSNFNGDISKWGVSKVTDTGDMFEKCSIPEENKPAKIFGLNKD